MSSVGLVTVLFNCPEVLADFFEGLARQDFSDYKLFIIDNSTNDASFLEASKLIDFHHLNEKATIIKNDTNVGVACANNQGITLSLEHDCESVLLLNNDITWEGTSIISSMVSYGIENTVDILIPKILYHETRKIWCAGGRFNLLGGYTTHRGEHCDANEFCEVVVTDYAPTCFMLISRRVFENVGLMDERYFVYYDDTDFIWRSKISGYPVHYFPDAVICHKVSSSTGGNNSAFSIYYASRNRIFFILKNLPQPFKFIAVSYSIATRLIYAYLLNRKFKRNYLKAIHDGLRMLN